MSGQHAAPSPTAPRAGLLGRVAAVAYRRRRRVLLGWLGAVAAAVALSTAFGGAFTADYSVPGSDSRTAQDLLTERFPARSGETVDLVVRSDGAPVTDPAVRAEVDALVGRVAGAAHVRAVRSPYEDPAGVSPDGTTARATVQLDVAVADDMPPADMKRIVALGDAAARPGLAVAFGGQAAQQAEEVQIGSEGIGLAAAAVILLLVFGSLVAAGLPLLVTVVGLGVSASLVGLVAAVLDVPDWGPALAAMMGIGVGVDYVLLMVTRYREFLARGLDPLAATAATADTAGRAVLVAGCTVVVSLLGLFGMGLPVMRGAALVTILAVLVVMLATVTLLPALLGFAGTRIDRFRVLRRAGRRAPVGERWSRVVQRRPAVSLVAGLVVLGVLMLPLLGLRFGFPDAGNDRVGSTTRQAYDLLARGFGPGANGPLVVTVAPPGAADALAGRLRGTPGVAQVLPAQVNPAGDTAVLIVVPVGSPQSAGTEALVHTLRDTVGGPDVHVGGVTATAIDSTEDTVRRLPLLIGGVVGLSFLLLLAVFRSPALAVLSSALNLVSVGAAYGVVALVLEGGRAGKLVGIDTATPLPAFIPVLMFAVLFGLSMDYQVFLLTRIREHWVRSGDSSASVAGGLAATMRVVTAAAAIMVTVFAAFVPNPLVFLKVMGVGMAAAILVDATVVRMLLMPAAMQLLGRANWWLPAWLDRLLPRVRIEGTENHEPTGQERALTPA